LKAKDFLTQLEKLDKLIENKTVEKAQWRSIATNVTAQVGGERVQSSGNPHKITDAIATYLDLEQEIDRFLSDQIEKKKDIIRVIEQLNPTEYDVLHKIYVQYKTLQEVADKYNRTYSWVTTIHGKALKNVQNILDERGM
jgi:DNA-directed RNA polymerase specialized sigma subunit